MFVQPRYMTSRAISHYAVPIAGLGAVFLGTTNVYRPEFRGGVVYNYGIPRDRVIKYGKRPIYVQKIYRVNDWRHGRFDKDDRNKGIKIYAPGFNKNGRDRGPKRFADHPNDFKPKAKLKDTYKGNLPKGWGDSAKDMKSVAKEDPDAFNKKHGKFGPDDEANRGKGDRDRDNNKEKNQASKGKDDNTGDRFKPGGPDQFKQGNRDNDKGDNDKGDNDKNKNKTFGNQGGPGGPSQFKQGNRDNDKDGKGDNDKNNKNGGNNNANNDAKTPPPPKSPPPIQKVIRDQGTTGSKAATGSSNQGDDKGNKGDDYKNKNFGSRPGGPDQFKQGSRDNDNDRGDNNNKDKNKNKNFGSQGGGGNQFKQGNRDNNGGGGGGTNQFKQGGGQGGGGGGGDKQRAQGGGLVAVARRGGGGGGGGDGGGGDKDKCKKNPNKPGCQNKN